MGDAAPPIKSAAGSSPPVERKLNGHRNSGKTGVMTPKPPAPPPSPPPSDLPQRELARLLAVMAALRDPERGCPWDQEQTFDTIAPYTIEEAYEVADAIARRDMADLPDELGDLLFQVVYHARMAEEAGQFGFAEVARAITDKMIRRHPHIFPADGADAGPAGWEEQKRRERAQRQRLGTLDGIPAGLPALTRALKITARAGRVGFDWPDPEHVLDKLEEEIAEVRAELPDADPERLADEVGDILFVAANLARKLGLDPEACLRQANAKFSRRFRQVEARVAAEGLSLADAGLDRMEGHWAAVKIDERLGRDRPDRNRSGCEPLSQTRRDPSRPDHSQGGLGRGKLI
ncbi:MAG: nucleoside triphosphate pyrophosphohydrolase [Acetobacteraceae bacterium]